MGLEKVLPLHPNPIPRTSRNRTLAVWPHR